MNQWYLLFRTRDYTEASIVQGVLDENEIPVQLMNKLDSSYLNFGDIEIYVPTHFKDIAADLLQKALLN
jgi:hypothetical protein